MSIPMGTVSLFCADGGAGCEPISAVVQSHAGERTVVAVADGGSERFEIGSACQIRYTDPKNGRFMGVSCVVESIDQERMTLRQMTQTRSANQRLSFRVNMAGSNIKACVGPFGACRVIDISASGIRVRAPEALVVGASVMVRFTVAGQVINGEYTVRRVCESGSGVQIGLAVNSTDRQLIDSLTQLVSGVEREQLRRRSRIVSGVNSGAGGEVDTADEMDEMDADEAQEEHAEAAPGGTGEDAWVQVPASVLAGRALPGSLVTGEGSVVASRGQVLSMDDFKRLDKEGIYATDDWSTEHADRRVNGRSSCACAVRVVALQGKQIMKMRADLTDISRGGVGLRTPTMLNEAVYLVIDFSNTKDRRWIIGKVVHRDIAEGETRCRLGVQFYMSAPQTGPVPDSVPAFAQWISPKPIKGKGVA